MMRSSDGKKSDSVVDIPALIADLAAAEGTQRQQARRLLVSIGRAAVPYLVECMSHPGQHVRWEATKALGSIRDPATAEILVGALEDKDGDVRWLAAVGLAALGRHALRPLLLALVDRPDRDWLREGAHHVCHNLARTHHANLVEPMLEALAQPEPEAAVPLAAYAVLKELEMQR